MGITIQVVYFIHILRKLNLRISSAEVMDCLNSLTYINILERQQFRVALACTLIKEEDDLHLFNKAFDVFFASANDSRHLVEEYGEQQEAIKQAIEQTDGELKYMGESLQLTSEEKFLYSQLTELEKANIRQFLERSNEGKKVDKNFKPIIENLISSSLAYWKRNLNREMDILPEEVFAQEELNMYYNLIKNQQAQEKIKLVDQDMKNIAQEDLTKTQLLIEKMAKNLAKNLSRRYRNSKKITRLNLPSSIRKNIKYGGTFFELDYKSKRLEQPNIILLCDVSGSMAKYANFVIQFMGGLTGGIKNIENFIFAEELEHISHQLKGKGDFTHVLLEIINNSSTWGKGTKLDHALWRLLQDYGHYINKKAVLFILSDGKTVSAETAGNHLKDVHQRVKSVIWLNTTPITEWEKISGIKVFQQWCQMYQCNTLQQLNKVITNQLVIS